MSFVDDLRNLDRNNIGGWPKSVKVFFCILLFVVVVAVGWYVWVRPATTTLESAQHKEQTLRNEFSEKQAKVVNLEALKKQLAEMQDMLKQLLRQLPSKTEMPALLVDISQTAQKAGLEVDVFHPQAEQVKQFYAEKPIKITMRGTYHQFGTFISGVASLPRVVILTMHDVDLKEDKDGPSNQLVMTGTVKTYRYLDQGEMDAQQQNGGAK